MSGRRPAGAVRGALLVAVLATVLAALSVLGSAPRPARADPAPPSVVPSGCPPSGTSDEPSQQSPRASGQSAPPDQGAAPSPVAVTITNVTPIAPQPGSQLTVTAAVSNAGPSAVDHVIVRLRLAYRPEGTRSQLDVDAAGNGEFNSNVPRGGEWVDPDPLRAGGCVMVQLHVDTAAIGFGTFGDPAHPGVYRMAVEVASIVDGSDLQPLARADTFICWMPTGSYQPLDEAWLWPIVDQPQVGPDGALRTNALVDELRPGGRLDSLLSAAVTAAGQSGTTAQPVPPVTPGQHARRPPTIVTQAAPVTYAIDPALIAAIAVMAKGNYRVHIGDRVVTSSAGTPDAKAFLQSLQQHVAPDTFIALPYADPDLSAIVRAGDADLLRDADNARDSVLAAAGLPEAAAAIAWPPNGYLAQSALDDISAPNVVVTGSELPRDRTDTTAPVTVPRAGGPVTVVPTDEALSALATGDGQETLVQRQQFLADTAMLVMEQPQRPRLVVIAPPHVFDPRGTVAPTLLSLSGQLPWLHPTGLQSALSSRPAPTVSVAALHYPDRARAAELPTPLIDDVSAAITAANGLRSMVCAPDSAPTPANSPSCTPDDVVLPLERALLGAVSATWRNAPTGARRLYAAAYDRIQGVMSHVHITSSGTVTMLSRSGSIPVTIANDLAVPVSVRLHVTTPNPAQLSVGSDKVYTIDAGDKFTETMQAHTPSAGHAKFPIYLQLETPEGTPLGPPSELIVKSSAYGTIAVAITAGALVVLFLTVTVRLGRTALRARRRERDAGSGGSTGGSTGGGTGGGSGGGTVAGSGAAT